MNERYPVWPGKPYPLGANWDGKGVNFALFSENATGAQLCLFESDAADSPVTTLQMTEQTNYVWHIYLPGVKPGQRYGFRVEGPHDPANGLRFNPNKLLLDPYAKAIDGRINWNDAVFGYPVNSPESERDLEMDPTDSAPFMNKSVVIDESFDWEGDHLLQTPLHETVIYETHVKGFTMQHPELDPSIRGTYQALGSEAVLYHLKRLGITAVELLPVHHFVHDQHLVDQGLANYWGYNSIGYFAPHSDYCSSGTMGEQVVEFKEMVKSLHRAGIEVILDVVYNHTAEGNHYGPTLSFKGIDNEVYYRLVEADQRFYMDYTGTGNSLNMVNPRSLQLVMDSLRYWVNEMHVDGFRFDLASTLARGLHEVGKLSTFLDTIHQDPIISQVKLIAEPWDIGEGGYQVGNFPVLWSEWNGKYRDSVRRFWKGDESQVAEFAYRLSGSSDLYMVSGRRPFASINFITAHDGFTLNDLVSYNEKHNAANGENNLDGESHNESWNCGVEGPTDDPEIRALREQQKRNFLATLFLSQGVPMLLSGDEYGRTQEGNNNVYCQDNELSWYDWNWTDEQRKLQEFCCQLIALRKKSHIFSRRKFFHGRDIRGRGITDIRWLSPTGQDMSEEEWNKDFVRCMGMLLNGEEMDEYDQKGRRITDDVYLLMVNSYWEEVLFNLPDQNKQQKWELVLDTYEGGFADDVIAGSYLLPPRSLVLLRKVKSIAEY